MSQHNVIAIKQPWATIAASVISSFAIGGFVFAWNVNAQVAQLEKLDDANLPERMAIIETKLVNIQEQNERIERKLDKVIDYDSESDRRSKADNVRP